MLLQIMQSADPTPIHLPTTLVTFLLVLPLPASLLTHTYQLLLLPELIPSTQPSGKPSMGACLH